MATQRKGGLRAPGASKRQKQGDRRRLRRNVLCLALLHDMETRDKRVARDPVTGLRVPCGRFDMEAGITAMLIEPSHRIAEVPTHESRAGAT